MRSNYWTIFKTLDLDSLALELENNARIYFNVINAVENNTEINNEILGIKEQINRILSSCNNRLTQIVPSRTKRALFSPLGSMIKLITGNLDNEDAMRYNIEISNLKKDEHNVQRKMSLMQVAMDRFINISSNLDHNTKELNLKTKEIDLILDKENTMFKTLQTINTLYQILNNFRTILDMIQEIETAIAFSKIHILHQSIINSTELFNFLSNIKRNNNYLVYELSWDNLIKIERSIILKSYMDKNKLVFILEVPLVEKDTYIYYKITPIPIYDPLTLKTYTIIPKHPYLLVNGVVYRPVVNPCEELESEKYICTTDNLEPVPAETCIEQLMMIRTNLTRCHKHPITIEKMKILRITFSQWIIYLREPTKISESCKNEVHNYNIKGTFLLTTNNNECKIQIEDTPISSLTKSSRIMFQLSSIHLPDVYQEIPKEAKQLDLREIDLSDVNSVVNQVKNIEKEENFEYYVKNDISVWTLSLYVILAIFIIIYLLCKFKNFQKYFISNKNSPKPSSSSSENFSLGEGGVKCSNPNDIPFVSTKQ